MTREIAMKLLKDVFRMCDFEDQYGDPIDDEQYYKSLEMAEDSLAAWDDIINELEKKTASEEYIKIQDVIDMIKKQLFNLIFEVNQADK